MNKQTSVRRTLYLSLAAVGLAVASGVAPAETPAEVVVQVVRPNRFGHLASPIEIVSVTRRVKYADLDLVTHAGAMELQARVKETAQLVCEELQDRYRMTGTERYECVKEAARDGLERAKAVIAAAEKSTRTAQIDTPR